MSLSCPLKSTSVTDPSIKPYYAYKLSPRVGFFMTDNRVERSLHKCVRSTCVWACLFALVSGIERERQGSRGSGGRAIDGLGCATVESFEFLSRWNSWCVWAEEERTRDKTEQQYQGETHHQNEHCDRLTRRGQNEERIHAWAGKQLRALN